MLVPTLFGKYGSYFVVDSIGAPGVNFFVGMSQYKKKGLLNFWLLRERQPAPDSQTMFYVSGRGHRQSMSKLMLEKICRMAKTILVQTNNDSLACIQTHYSPVCIIERLEPEQQTIFQPTKPDVGGGYQYFCFFRRGVEGVDEAAQR